MKWEDSKTTDKAEYKNKTIRKRLYGCNGILREGKIREVSRARLRVRRTHPRDVSHKCGEVLRWKSSMGLK